MLRPIAVLGLCIATALAKGQAPIERRPPLPVAPLPQSAPPVPPPYACGYPYPCPYSWPPRYREPDTAGPTLAGFAIGFGLGAGVGAANASDGNRSQNAVFGGLVFGLLGAFIGHELGALHHNAYRMP